MVHLPQAVIAGTVGGRLDHQRQLVDGQLLGTRRRCQPVQGIEGNSHAQAALLGGQFAGDFQGIHAMWPGREQQFGELTVTLWLLDNLSMQPGECRW